MAFPQGFLNNPLMLQGQNQGQFGQQINQGQALKNQVYQDQFICSYMNNIIYSGSNSTATVGNYSLNIDSNLQRLSQYTTNPQPQFYLASPPKKESNIDWLDKRVNEIRYKL